MGRAKLTGPNYSDTSLCSNARNIKTVGILSGLQNIAISTMSPKVVRKHIRIK